MVAEPSAAAQATPAPFEFETPVQPDWIDPNGHMNVARHAFAFDLASDTFCDRVGVGCAYMRATGTSSFAPGMNLDYRRALFEADSLRITTQLLPG